MDMLAELDRIVKEVMPDLVMQPDKWWLRDFMFDGPKFKIKRLYTKVGDTRIRLHYFQTYDTEAMIHYHIWPMAAKILEGSYEHQVGYSNTNEAPPKMMKLIMQTGNSYEMVDQHIWHSVKPLEPTWTILVHGDDFEGNRGDPTGGGVTTFPVSPATVAKALWGFRRFFPRPDAAKIG